MVNRLREENQHARRSKTCPTNRLTQKRNPMTRQNETHSVFPRVVDMHTCASISIFIIYFKHSALAQRGIKLHDTKNVKTNKQTNKQTNKNQPTNNNSKNQTKTTEVL